MDLRTLALVLLPSALWLSSLAAAIVLRFRGARHSARLTFIVAIVAWLPLPVAALTLAALAGMGLGSREPPDAVSWWLLPAWAALAACLVAAPLAWMVAFAALRSPREG